MGGSSANHASRRANRGVPSLPRGAGRRGAIDPDRGVRVPASAMVARSVGRTDGILPGSGRRGGRTGRRGGGRGGMKRYRRVLGIDTAGPYAAVGYHEEEGFEVERTAVGPFEH